MSKLTVIASVLVVTLAFIGGISVVGLLETTESVSSSGIVIQPPPPPIPLPLPPPEDSPLPPPEPTVEIDVYCDIDCTETLYTVTWGEIQIGGSVSSKLFIKNNGDSGIDLSLLTDNWNPVELESYMTLNWDYDGSTIQPREVVEIILILSISPDATEITTFSFDIILVGSAI
jgi:hypothetical protein